MSVKTHIAEVTRDLYVLRVDDEKVRYFEALWEIPERISYNAYLLLKGDHVVLFDGWKSSYSTLFLESIEKIVSPRDITEVVVHHLEPDHSGSIPALLRVNERAVFMGHPLAGKMLSSFYGVSRFRPIPDNSPLDLGTKARFIYIPWLHWPETSATFLEEEGVLLTCDVFGSYSLPPLFDDSADLAELEQAVTKYFVTVIGHYAPFAGRALRKMEELSISPRVIAPGHGTIFRRNINWVLSLYARLSSDKLGDRVTITYVTMYGGTEPAVETVKQALREKGVEVAVYRFSDETRDSIAEALASMAQSRLVVLGAATYESDAQPLMRFLVDLIGEKLSYRKNLPFLVLSPYGWGGVAGKKIAERLRSYGFTTVEFVEWEGRLTDQVAGRIRDSLSKLI